MIEFPFEMFSCAYCGEPLKHALSIGAENEIKCKNCGAINQFYFGSSGKTNYERYGDEREIKTQVDEESNGCRNMSEGKAQSVQRRNDENNRW